MCEGGTTLCDRCGQSEKDELQHSHPLIGIVYPFSKSLPVLINEDILHYLKEKSTDKCDQNIWDKNCEICKEEIKGRYLYQSIQKSLK